MSAKTPDPKNFCKQNQGGGKVLSAADQKYGMTQRKETQAELHLVLCLHLSDRGEPIWDRFGIVG